MAAPPVSADDFRWALPITTRKAELTDVVYVELPKAGAQVTAGQQACVVESVKAASDIYSPISGTITAVNDALTSNPALINTDPYGEGWIFKIKVEAGEEIEELKEPRAISGTDRRQRQQWRGRRRSKRHAIMGPAFIGAAALLEPPAAGARADLVVVQKVEGGGQGGDQTLIKIKG